MKLEFPGNKTEQEISEAKWFKLLDKTRIHPRKDVLQRWVTDSASFDQHEFKKMKQHVGICPHCIQALKNTVPLLHDQEKAS